MATEKQIKAISNMVENGGIASRAMVDAGYSEATAKTPQKLTESKGFKELCEEYGLTDGLIIESLVEDIRLKPQNRKPELELGAKIRGMLVDKTDITTNGKPITGITYIQPNGNSDNPNNETTPSVGGFEN